MFSYIRRAFDAIKITERAGIYTVSGVPSSAMVVDIASLWGTSRITNNIFTDIDAASFSFYAFFALEVDYAINKLLAAPSVRTNRRSLRLISQELRKETWLKNIDWDGTKPAESVLNKSKLKLFDLDLLPYQERFLQEFDKAQTQMGLTGFILAGAPGSGKTYMGLALGEVLEADYVYVVCPKIATELVWQDNIHKRYKKPPTYWIQQHGMPYKGERICICHYEALEALVQISLRHRNKKVLVILDESHNLTNESAQRTDAFISMVNNMDNRVVLWASGTPFKAMGSEAVAIMRTIDPLFTEAVAVVFAKIFGASGSQAYDMLTHRLGLMETIIEKKELGRKPPQITTFKVQAKNAHEFTLPAVAAKMVQFIEERREFYKSARKTDEAAFESFLQMLEEQRLSADQKMQLEEYREAARRLSQMSSYMGAKDLMDITRKIERNFIIPSLPQTKRKEFAHYASIYKYTPLKIRGECLGRVLGRMRIDCIKTIAQNVDYAPLLEQTENKTVVFTSHVDVLEAAQNQLLATGHKPVLVYGKTNKDLLNIVQRFEADPQLNPLIATYNSLSTAVPLVMADNMILLNVPFRAYVFDQAIARIDRLGAKDTVSVSIATLDTGSTPNLSDRSVDIMTWSQAQVEKIMGVKSPYEIEPLPALESYGLMDLPESKTLQPSWSGW